MKENDLPQHGSHEPTECEYDKKYSALPVQRRVSEAVPSGEEMCLPRGRDIG